MLQMKVPHLVVHILYDILEHQDNVMQNEQKDLRKSGNVDVINSEDEDRNDLIASADSQTKTLQEEFIIFRFSTNDHSNGYENVTKYEKLAQK